MAARSKKKKVKSFCGTIFLFLIYTSQNVADVWNKHIWVKIPLLRDSSFIKYTLYRAGESANIRPAVQYTSAYRHGGNDSLELRWSFRVGRKGRCKWLWTEHDCFCQMGWSDYFRNSWSTGKFPHSHLSGEQRMEWKQKNIQRAAVV